MPCVSVVIPVFNDVRYLALAVESVLAQDYPDLEMIIVDDGSTDGSEAIAASYGDRCRVVRQENAGQSAALGTGWALARGELLGYLSSDDLLERNAVSTLTRVLLDTPTCVLAYPDFRVIDAEGRASATVRPPKFSRRALYGRLHCLPGPGGLFRRSAYEVAGPWRTDMRQIPDLEFYFRLALLGDFIHVPEALADFRRHPASTTYRPIPLQRAHEPVMMVEHFFRREDLPIEIAREYRRALASAKHLTALMHGQSRRPRLAASALASALIADPLSLASHRGVASLRAVARGLLRRGADGTGEDGIASKG